MSQQTNKKKRKVKRKVSVSTSAHVRKKSEQPKDTIQKDTLKNAPIELPRTNGAVLKIKIKRK